MILLFIAFICIPIMLLPKPIIEIKKLKLKKKDENPLMLENDLKDEMDL
jgi:hypothetical protein